jgi:hypothetical protein
MSKEKNEHRQNMPLWCRILLRIPQLDLGVFGERFQGIFWIIVVPVFLFCDFFMNLYVIMALSFPVNFVILLFTNLVIALFLLRILVDRTLQAQEAILSEGRFQWDVESSFKEYLSILNKKKTEKDSEKR